MEIRNFLSRDEIDSILEDGESNISDKNKENNN